MLITELIKRDSIFIQSLDNDISIINEEEMYYLESLYLNPSYLDYEKSLNLMNILVKYDFKQVEEYSFLIYYKFGLKPFNEFEFMNIPKEYIKDVYESEIFDHVYKNNMLNSIVCIYSLGNSGFIPGQINFKQKLLLNGLEVAKWIYSLDNEVLKYTDQLFESCCYYNQLDSCKWLLSLSNDIEINNQKMIKAFSLPRSNYSIDINLVKWLYSFDKIDLNNIIEPLFEKAFINGDLNIIKFLCLNLKDNSYLPTMNDFKNVCYSGNLECLVWLCENYDFNNVININEIFHSLYLNHQLEVVKYIYYNYKIDLEYEYFYNIFIFGLKFGNINLVKWLYSIHDYTDCIKKNISLTNLYSKYGNIDIVKWLYSLNIYSLEKSLFNEVCSFSKFEIAKWMYSFGTITIDENDKDLFIDSIKFSNNYDYISWIYSLYDFSFCLKEAFYNACILNKIKIAKWLYTLGEYDVGLSFKMICKSGYNEIFIWLKSINRIKFEFNDTEVLLISDGTNYKTDNKYIINWIKTKLIY
jgi:hypothetical protein